MHATTQDITAHKIEMASDAIKAENNRRRKLNKKKSHIKLPDGRTFVANPMPMLRPSYQEVGTRRAIDKYGYKGKVIASKKFLVGRLGHLCQVMRDNDIAYPWRD